MRKPESHIMPNISLYNELVLIVFNSCGETYGYELIQILKDQGLPTSCGSIYPLLARLRKHNLIEPVSGSQKYRITELGRGELKRMAALREALAAKSRKSNTRQINGPKVKAGSRPG